MNTDRLKAALEQQNVQAFLRTIRVGEGTSDEGGYARLFGGGAIDSFAEHPNKRIPFGKTYSTAAGAYQFLFSTWNECKAALALPDFSPASQDLAAVFLIDRRKALDDVLAGRIEAAIAKCAKEWASLPGSPYGQPTVTLAKALEAYAGYGGDLTASEPVPYQTKGVPVDPITGLALAEIVKAVPWGPLASMFSGNQSEVAKRNVKAATMVVGAVTDALGAKNEQDAMQQLQTGSPEVIKAATEAVKAVWPDVVETGSSGIDGARKADLAMSGGDIKHSPSFWIAILLLPMVYLIVANVVGIVGKPLNDEVRSAISNGVVGLILGGLIGYYYGQTTSRNRA